MTIEETIKGIEEAQNYCYENIRDDVATFAIKHLERLKKIEKYGTIEISEDGIITVTASSANPPIEPKQ